MIKYIVYKSETGHSKEYANLLGKETGFSVFELKEAIKKLPKNSEIIFIGWLMAGKISGYKKAVKRFAVRAVCAVGMSSEGSQQNNIAKTNKLRKDLPLYYLQGGFELDKLHGIYRIMMSVMKKTLSKGLADKKNRTSLDDEMLDIMVNGRNLVKKENLSEILTWIENDK